MGRRVVNGSSFSENGWPLVDQAGCRWVTVPGTNVSLQVQDGPPAIIMPAWAADWNAYIEPLRDADSASWTDSNSVLGGFGKNNGSNHLGGTAEDLNWNSHAFQKRGSLNNAQMQTLSEMEDFYEGNMFWAGRWDDPADEMHSQMGYGTYDQNNDRPEPKVFDFINRKIRPDGFSTFRRGGDTAPPAPTPSRSAAQVLADATRLDLDRATEILPTVVSGLAASQCNNVNRIAMWLAQCGHESANFNATEEYASGAEYEGRCSDLGNCSPGDGVKYKGRTWIQITGKVHYQEFSQWAFENGFIGSPTQFVDDPESLGDLRWAGIGAAWYWTVSRPQINSLCDAGDLVGVTKAINGGTNGLEDSNGNPGRRSRYGWALDVGDRLLALIGPATQGDDELSAEAERMIREMYDEYRANRGSPSRSFFAKDQVWTESPLGFLWNIDGNVNEIYMTWGYLLGVTSIEADVEYIAANGVAPQSWAGSQVNAAGQRWLAEVGQQWCQGLIDLRTAMQGAFQSSSTPAVAAEPRTIVTPEPRVVYVDRPVPASTAQPAGSTGQVIGQAYDSLEALLASGALTDAEQGPLNALISVLQTKSKGASK